MYSSKKPFWLEDARREMEHAGVGEPEQDQEGVSISSAASAGEHSQSTTAEASYSTASSNSNTTLTTSTVYNTAKHLDGADDDIPAYLPSWAKDITPNVKKPKIKKKQQQVTNFQLADSEGRLPGEVSEQQHTASTDSGSGLPVKSDHAAAQQTGTAVKDLYRPNKYVSGVFVYKKVVHIV